MTNFRTPGITVYYDGDCGFCKKTVLILKKFFLLPEATLLPAQSDTSVLADMQRHNSWVVVNHRSERFFEARAFAEVCRASPLLWPFAPLLAWPPVNRWLTRLYRMIARNRDCCFKKL